MLARFLTNGNIPVAQATFADTKNNASKDAIEFVEQTGLFNGTSETTFDPNGTITRAQMAGVMARWIERECAADQANDYYQQTGEGKVFMDVNSTHWAATVSALGIMSGNSATTFNQQGALTRAQVVKVLNQIFGRTALEDVNTSSFTNVPSTHWALGDIEAAAIEQTLKK